MWGSNSKTVHWAWGCQGRETHHRRRKSPRSGSNDTAALPKPLLPPDWGKEPTANYLRPWKGAAQGEHQKAREWNISGFRCGQKWLFSLRQRRAPTEQRWSEDHCFQQWTQQWWAVRSLLSGEPGRGGSANMISRRTWSYCPESVDCRLQRFPGFFVLLSACVKIFPCGVESRLSGSWARPPSCGWRRPGWKTLGGTQSQRPSVNSSSQ